MLAQVNRLGLAGERDVLLLQLGFWKVFHRSELAGLQISHVVVEKRSLAITTRRPGLTAGASIS